MSTSQLLQDQLIRKMEKLIARPEHAERVAARQASNGQPNGYKPVREADLIEIRNLKADRDQYIADGGRYWHQDSFTVFAVNEIDQEIAKIAA